MELQTVAPAAASSIITPQPLVQHGASETYSDNILGPVAFKMSNLRIAGTNKKPAASAQSPYIIGSQEAFSVSVDIEFNRTPLTALLMCLGTKLSVDFAFEGYGQKAVEIDLIAAGKTQKSDYTYTLTYTGTPAVAGLTSGLYQVAAIATIGPVDNECSSCVFGHGYLERVLVEVYPSNEECGQ